MHLGDIGTPNLFQASFLQLEKSEGLMQDLLWLTEVDMATAFAPFFQLLLHVFLCVAYIRQSDGMLVF